MNCPVEAKGGIRGRAMREGITTTTAITLFVFASLFAGLPTMAQTVILDTEFHNFNWSHFEFLDLSGTGSYNVGQVTGGNPGFARWTTIEMNSQSVDGVWSIKRNASYTPTTLGNIGQLDCAFDARFDTALVTNRVNYILTLLQFNLPDSSFYMVTTNRSITGITFDNWVPIAWSSLTADSFFNVSSTGPATPDFSSSGGRIQFGLVISYASPQPGPSYIVTTIDNYKVSLFDCAGDPLCDAAVNILDVITTIEVAFRGGSSITDPGCGWERSDLNCDGATDVQDVIRVINVAFRGFEQSTQFCDPCP